MLEKNYMLENSWTAEFPTEPDTMWWFYGWPYGLNIFDKSPELNIIKVFQVSNGIAHTRNGSFYYKSDGGVGLFKKITLPQLPDLENLKEQYA